MTGSKTPCAEFRASPIARWTRVRGYARRPVDQEVTHLLAEVVKALRSGRAQAVHWAAHQAVELGPDGERVLAEALPKPHGASATSPSRPSSAMPPATLAPRRCAPPSRSRARAPRDLRCAALLALAKGSGADATPDLVIALTSRDTAVREYAIACLAGTDDERGYDATHEWLRQQLRRSNRREPAPMQPAPVTLAIAYLARHAPVGSARLTGLVTLLRGSWGRLYPRERAWFSAHWRDAAPDGPPVDDFAAPGPAALRSWASWSICSASSPRPGCA